MKTDFSSVSIPEEGNSSLLHNITLPNGNALRRLYGTTLSGPAQACDLIETVPASIPILSTGLTPGRDAVPI